MNKYIISNCPALDDQGRCFQGSATLGTAFKECQERQDCLIKKVIKTLDFRNPVLKLIEMREVG